MKIKNISCTQFAGIRDRSISFDDGINLIYGKNESGKSTLVNLISRTFFQNARIDGRRDKEFKELYFPGMRKGSTTRGDFADGKITFDADNKTYTLSKEWGNDARCTLSTPDGVIRDQKKINAVLSEILLYGEGVYSDMLFSSQRNMNASLQSILDASKKTDAKQEITAAVTQAFSEGDGITADAIEQAINRKIDEISGKHWDTDRNMPARKAGRWVTGLGEILKAYYEMEDAQKVLGIITNLENESDSAIADYAKKDQEAHLAEEAYEDFHTYAGQLTIQSERRKRIENLKKESDRLKEILSAWPKLMKTLEKAAALNEEMECRQLLDKYESAKKLTDEMDALRREVANLACPAANEISDVKSAQRKITTLENKLCGMNLNAVIKMFDDHSINISALRTGQPLDITDQMAITEAVKITVPGVMEMQLSPADVNVSKVEAAIAEQKKIVNAIFERYGTGNLDALEQLAQKFSDNEAQIKLLSERLSNALGTVDYTELESKVNAITGEIRSKDSIADDILSVCGSNDIVRYITTKETIIQGYVDEYGSLDSLKAKAYDTETELKKAQGSIMDMQDVPAEYACIADPENYLAQLQRELNLKRSVRETALKAKTEAVSKLETYKENLATDPVENAGNAERKFEETRKLLGHWLHIARVFAQLKQNVRNNPMQDLSDSFTRYLGIISGGKISSEFPNPEKLSMNIYSGSSLVDYGKLSEGTKETVSLAFRLAVLDHLFPDGGGVIVFDDPFTDMDADRTVQSCELIKDCAKRHQVIFLTCKEEYANMLGGNEISLEV
ncbi:MAG: AAA family ATPase [Lachnospiraceae bacterium]|nr:AAA family ATPase [Lachnospiraceae bacterium]